MRLGHCRYSSPLSESISTLARNLLGLSDHLGELLVSQFLDWPIGRSVLSPFWQHRRYYPQILQRVTLTNVLNHLSAMRFVVSSYQLDKAFGDRLFPKKKPRRGSSRGYK
jgi:hypothetical protein